MGVGISGQEVPSGPDSNICSHHAQLGYTRKTENDALGRVCHEETWSHRAPYWRFSPLSRLYWPFNYGKDVIHQPVASGGMSRSAIGRSTSSQKRSRLVISISGRCIPSTYVKPKWRCGPMRLTAMFIEEMILKGLQWYSLGSDHTSKSPDSQESKYC